MKRALLATLTVIGFSLTAQAADYPVLRGTMDATPPGSTYVPNWSAIYGGLHLGAVFGNAALDGVLSNNFKSGSGVLGGGQIGADVQIDNFVYGAVVDISYSGASQSVGTVTYSLPYQGSARLRFGYLLMPKFLVYATGGLAFASDRVEDTSSRFDNSRGHVGWTIGAGGEFLFARSWSAFGEYRYTDLGSASWLGGPFGTTATDVRSGNHTVRAGLNYRFSTGSDASFLGGY